MEVPNPGGHILLRAIAPPASDLIIIHCELINLSFLYFDTLTQMYVCRYETVNSILYVHVRVCGYMELFMLPSSTHYMTYICTTTHIHACIVVNR